MGEIGQDGVNIHLTNLKLLKEQFVSGLEGTTSWELLLICATSVVGVLFYYAVLPLLIVESQSSKIASYFFTYLVLEVVSFWIPMVLCQTIWLHPYGTYYMNGQICLSFLAIFVKQFRRNDILMSVAKKPDTDSDTMIIASLQRTAVTIYRACLLFLTIIAILAVDFRVFPRRFGKTESRGYGLMDLGAASFVVAAGMVSPRAKRYSTSGPDVVWSKQVQRMIPLLLMGSLRLITHKGLDYPEHVSEYGVHWNFFFTLASVMPIATLLSRFQSSPSWIVPSILLIVYQYMLSMEGLQQWVEDSPRVCPSTMQEVFGNVKTLNIICNLWYANREGIFGCVSYAALYLFSEWWAFSLYWHASLNLPDLSTNTVAILWHGTGKLWLSVAALFSLWQCLESFGFHVSRRSTNAIFCAWVLFVNVLLMVAIFSVIVFFSVIKLFNTSYLEPPPVLAAVNRNGLSTFIIANLLTGLVNLSINTLAVQNDRAIVVLTLYVSVVGLIGVVVDRAWMTLSAFQQDVLQQQSSPPNSNVAQMKKEN
jgi:glucosaminylphosphatidylinositol acyltransferase